MLPSLSFNTILAPGTPVPDTLVSPAFGSVIIGFALSSCAFAIVASSVAAFFPGSVCSAVTFSPSTNLSAGMFSTFQLPSLSTVASPILLPALSFNTTVAPVTPVPDTFVSPAFGAVIVGFALASCAFAFTVVFSSAGFLSFSVCVTTISWPFVRVSPSGTSTDQVPSSFTVVSPITSSPLVTTISDPATPLPEIVPSFSVTSLIVGFSDVSFFLLAVAIIFALSFVIAVPGVVDHVGFSYPSFAFAVGYLSVGNFVPSFTS